MAVGIRHLDDKTIAVHLSGKLQKEDYERFVPELEQTIEKQGKVRMLVEMQDFHGWGAAALWEDVKVAAKHFNDIERIAFVGEARWQKGMAAFCKPFTAAEIRYFEPAKAELARSWLKEEPR